MGINNGAVDGATVEEVTAALKKVNRTPGLKIKTGTQALVRIYQSPGHSIARQALEKEFGALDLHFGWLCRRVAELLGDDEPEAFALTDINKGMITLKPSVVAALKASGLKH